MRSYFSSSSRGVNDGLYLVNGRMNVSECRTACELINKNINKQDLKEAAGISVASIAKLGKGGNITTDVFLKIC